MPVREVKGVINNYINSQLKDNLENYTQQSEHVDADSINHPIKKSSLDSNLSEVPEKPIGILISSNDSNKQ